MTADTHCRCGSGLAYAACCGRFHQGIAAPTAEALMRSRYSAYLLQLDGYLLDTWHASTRPATLAFSNAEPAWCGLELRDCHDGGVSHEYGEVEFVARWLAPDGRCGSLHERSRFKREAGRWYYVDGELFPTVTHKVGRNDACPCGSGRKYKQCCGY